MAGAGEAVPSARLLVSELNGLIVLAHSSPAQVAVRSRRIEFRRTKAVRVRPSRM
jgi:hypothetical protein